MMNYTKRFLLITIFCLSFLMIDGIVVTKATPHITAHNEHVYFIENVGQFADEVQFYIQGTKQTMWLAQDAMWLTIIENDLQGTKYLESQHSHLRGRDFLMDDNYTMQRYAPYDADSMSSSSRSPQSFAARQDMSDFQNLASFDAPIYLVKK